MTDSFVYNEPDIKEILNLLQAPTPADIALITKAYDFAHEAHKDHKRFSGEPYFIHLFSTAKTLAELGMGPVTISSGLLHDCIEDVNVTPELLEREFGKEIRFLVEGVTKLGKLKYRGAERYVESLRKLFVAMAEDLRVLIIKLADRLHNMRTLEHVRKEKQFRIASETLEIFAPLAYRLGIRKIHRELEDLSFAYVYPEEYERMKKIIKEQFQKSQDRLIRFHKSVAKILVKKGVSKFRTEYRIKGLYSLYQKLERRERNIENIYDIMALRIIVQDIEECYKTLGIIHSVWRPLPGRIKDYIALEKPNGYKSIHTTVFTGDGSIIEIQIRTEEMHRSAEYGIASHFEYKDSLNKEKVKASSNIAWVKQFLPIFKEYKDKTVKRKNVNENKDFVADVPSWIKELAQYESNSSEQTDYIESIKTDFFENRVFVFTPKGDVVDLPLNSTVLDFAYAIHSDIGNHTASAKINGKIAPIDKEIKNGDVVEIVTKESSQPTQKWLSHVKTTLARRHITSSLEKKKK
jgi:GTP pyrophosphokinase